MRLLSIPTVRDRTVQKAVVNVMEPIYEKDFAPNSYGFRPGRGCKNVLREVEKQLKGGQFWVVKINDTRKLTLSSLDCSR